MKAIHIKITVILSYILFLSACGSSGGSTEKLEESALPPRVIFPTEGAVVNKATEIAIDLDDSVKYQSIKLLIDDTEIATDTEAPYTFTLNPYFMSDVNAASLSIKATTQHNSVLSSEEIKVTLDHSTNSTSIKITDAESLKEQPYGTTHLPISWVSIAGAIEYEYRANSSGVATTKTPRAEINLTEDINTVNIRASDGNQWGSWAELAKIKVLPPKAPRLSFPFDDDTTVITVETLLDPAANFTHVDLVVNDEVVFTSTEAPHTFLWDPYFGPTFNLPFGSVGYGVEKKFERVDGTGFDTSAPTTEYQWWVEATLDDGRVFSSNAIQFNMADPQINQRFTIELPEGGPDYKGIDSLTISWNSIDLAESYEYKLDQPTTNLFTTWRYASVNETRAGSSQSFTLNSSFSPSDFNFVNIRDLRESETINLGDRTGVEFENLKSGNYAIHIRAVDSMGRAGFWNTKEFTIATPETTNTATSN